MNTQKLKFIPALFLLACSTAVAGAASMRDIIRAAMPTVVEVHVYDEKGTQTGSGSGFIVNRNGLIVTNYHVIEKASRAKVVLDDGEKVSVVGVRVADRGKDFAILQVDVGNLQSASLGDSDRLEAGDVVVAIGAPRGLAKTPTNGMFSKFHRDEERRMIQHTAPISPGSSGGPLFDLDGRVVGINTQLMKDSQGLFFALPINYVKLSLGSLPDKVITLPQLAKEHAVQDEEVAKDEFLKFVKKNFFQYSDPDNLFKMMIPKAWQVQRSVTEDEEGNTIVRFMAADPDAEQAKLKGWLSAGIRVKMVIPKKGGKWSAATRTKWAQEFISGSLAGYSKAQPGEPAKTTWSKREGVEIRVIGTTDKLSKQELTHLTVLPGEDVLISIEVTLPADQKGLFEVVQAVCKATFSMED